MIPEVDSAVNAGETAGTGEASLPDAAPPAEAQADQLAAGANEDASTDVPAAGSEAESQAEPGDEAALAALTAEVRRLAAAAEQYQERARQREGVIDYLRSELELLRRGERRGLLRPVLTVMARLHADLARQATSLRPDFTAEQAANLLDNYADELRESLADNGVLTYQPEIGDLFDPRQYRQVTKPVTTPDLDLDGRIAAVRKPGYRDIEADSLLSPAEVTLYKTVKEEQ
ncbi:MAG TPA: nucleotide exchange factor GrpE [Trebonia sp.]|jgi:molecular chaperone GrpE (heat shock protein)|nr:nucleotide exchange factor GrpE [Trebonia sp.]